MILDDTDPKLWVLFDRIYHNDNFYLLEDILNERLIMMYNLASKMSFFLTHHYGYREWCAVQHPDLDVYKCASAYQMVKETKNYDKLNRNVNIFNNYKGKESVNYQEDMEAKARYLLYVGFFLYMVRIDLNKGIAILITAGITFYLSSFYYNRVYIEFGVDTVSYLT